MRISDWSSDVCSSDLLTTQTAENDGLPDGNPDNVVELLFAGAGLRERTQLITSIQIDEFDQFRQLELERNRHQAAVRLKIRRQIKRKDSFELFRLFQTNGAVQPIAAIADPAETRSRCRNSRNNRNRIARTPVHQSACKSAKLDVLIDSRVDRKSVV